MDVKTAFLNGSLDCEIYMPQPEGFVDPDRPNHVCKLKKSIYGLKQSARCWNTTLDEYLKSVGYRKSKADKCIYVKSVKEANGHISFVILGVYVDDIIPVSNDPAMLKAEKAALCERFEMIDQGEIHYLLGLSIKRDRESRTLTISQLNYTEKVLRKFGMENCKPVSTPLEPGRKFQQLSSSEEPFDIPTYQQAIGCLTCMYVFQFGNATISWSSRKQPKVAKSSTEAEYVALNSATQEAIWLRRLMKGFGKQTDAPTTVYEDNQGTIELAKNAKYHSRTKHIDICHHFVRERVVSNEIRVIYCRTEDMVADIMRKGLPKPIFEKLRDLLGVHDVV